MVEHDEDTMYAADYIIDMGPGAGIHGGNVVSEGHCGYISLRRISNRSVFKWKKDRECLKKDSKPNGKWLEIIGANENNLKNMDVKIPLGVFTCVTGVSGSGKSSFVMRYFTKSLATS